MKRTILIITLLSLFICSYLNKSLLSQEISAVEIIPEYPTNTDEVLLAVTTTFPFLECKLDSIHPYFACGAFAYDAFYGTSFESGSCSRTDTISLGILPNGFYPVTYRMYYLGWAQVDQIDTTVSVGAVGIDEENYYEAEMHVWPNPSRGTVNISTGKEIGMIRINAFDGSLISTYNIYGDNHDLRLTLPAGLYICTPFRHGKPLSSQKLIVTEQ